MRREVNSYSPHWFEFFHVGIAETRTTREVDFICACAPSPRFRDILDVCCGMGRHARALVSRSYNVVGVERDSAAIARARKLSGGPRYVHADVRDYPPKTSAYDVAIVMSQSFGYFDAATNRKVLQQLASGLRKGGRVVLDLWQPEFFVAHQGERDFQVLGGIVRERKVVKDGRLFVQLEYPDGAQERFEWQLFTPAEMTALANEAGLSLIATCTDFDLAIKPDAAKPRIQFVLERESLWGSAACR